MAERVDQQKSTTDINSNDYWTDNIASGGGVKRKHATVEEEDRNKWTERQSILNMSMTKLQPSVKSKVEASLRRSVLIFNTLRYLESQLKQDSPQTDLAIPSKDTCLEPCHTDEVVCISKEEERLMHEKLVKQEVRERHTFTPLETVVNGPTAGESFGVTQYSAAQYENTMYQSSYPQYQTSTHQYQYSTQYETASSGQYPNSTAIAHAEYQQQQYPEQLNTQNATSYNLLDSLLGPNCVGEKAAVSQQFTAEQAPMWEEPDNVIWNPEYDEPFTSWLLNDDIDHIMQVLVSGSAS